MFMDQGKKQEFLNKLRELELAIIKNTASLYVGKSPDTELEKKIEFYKNELISLFDSCCFN